MNMGEINALLTIYCCQMKHFGYVTVCHRILFINRSINTFCSIQCEQFKEKLSEIRGWGQADRHFAAHYRLFHQPP
jgi:hypothetical protein